MTTPIVINIQLTGNAKSAVAAVRQLEKSLKDVTVAGAKANAAVASSTKNVTAGTTANNIKKLNGQLRDYTTRARLAADNGEFLTKAWARNSDVIDKRYLRSIRGLRDALHRMNLEGEKMLVMHQGQVKSFNDASLAFERYMLRGNLVTRTLDNMSRNLINMGKNAQWTGRQMMVGITAPLMAIGALSVKTAMDIQSVELELKKVTDMAEDTRAWEVLDKQTRQLSERFGVTRRELKELQVQFARTGFAGGDIQRAVQMTVELSKVGDVDLQTSAGLIEMLRKVGLEWADITDQLEKFNVMDDRTNLALRETSASLKEVFPTARQFGLTAAETSALMAGITQQGFDAAEAANTLNYALVKIPTALANMHGGVSGGAARLKDLQQQIENISARANVKISLFDDQGEMKSGLELLKTIALAHDQLLKSGEALNSTAAIAFRRAAFGTEHAPEGLALMTSLADAMNGATKEGRDLAIALDIASGKIGAFAGEWARQLANVEDADVTKIAGQIQKIVNSAQDIGRKLLPYVVKFLEFVNNIISKFESLGEGTQKALISIAVGLATIGPIVYIAGQGMIMLGTLARGLIAPFKNFFRLIHREKDSYKWTDEFSKGMENLHEQFSKTGDINAFKAGVNDLIDSTRISTAVTDAATDALHAEAVAHGRVAAAIDAQTAAQMRLNAAASAPIRSGPGGALNRAAIEGIASQHIPAMTIDEVFDEDAARRRVRERLFRNLANKRRAERISTRQEVTPYRFGSTYAEVEKLMESIAASEPRISELSNPDVFRKLITDAAEGEMPDLDSLLSSDRNRRAALEALRARIKAFEDAWGVPLPIKPDYGPDFDAPPHLVLENFITQLDAFEESLAKDLGGFKTSLRSETLARFHREVMSGQMTSADIDDIVEDALKKSLGKTVRSQPDMMHRMFRDAMLEADIAIGKITPREALEVRGSLKETVTEMMKKKKEGEIATGTPRFFTGGMVEDIKRWIEEGPGAGELSDVEEKVFRDLARAFEEINEAAEGKGKHYSRAVSKKSGNEHIRRAANQAAKQISQDVSKKDRELFRKLRDSVNRRFGISSERAEEAIASIDQLLMDIGPNSEQGQKLETIRRVWERRKNDAERAVVNINNAVAKDLVPLEADIRDFMRAERLYGELADQVREITGERVFRKLKPFDGSAFVEAARRNQGASGKFYRAGINASADEIMSPVQGGAVSAAMADKYRDAMFRMAGTSREEMISEGDKFLSSRFRTLEPSLEDFADFSTPRESGRLWTPTELKMFNERVAKANEEKMRNALKAFNQRAFAEGQIGERNLIALAEEIGMPSQIREAVAAGAFGGYDSSSFSRYLNEKFGEALDDEGKYVIHKMVAELLDESGQVETKYIAEFDRIADDIKRRLTGTGGARGRDIDATRTGDALRRDRSGRSEARLNANVIKQDLDFQLQEKQKEIDKLTKIIEGAKNEDIADARRTIAHLEREAAAHRQTVQVSQARLDRVERELLDQVRKGITSDPELIRGLTSAEIEDFAREDMERLITRGSGRRAREAQKLRNSITKARANYDEANRAKAEVHRSIANMLREVDEAPRELQLVQSEMADLKKRRDGVTRLYTNLAKEAAPEADDLAVLESVFTTGPMTFSKAGKDAVDKSGKVIRKGVPGGVPVRLPNFAPLVGGLSPQMASVLHNLVVMQDFSEADAIRAVRNLMPNLPKEMEKQMAQQASAVARALLNNREQAEAIFGRELFAEIARNERESSFSRTPGLGREGRVNTLDPNTADRLFSKDAKAFAAGDEAIEAAAAKSSKDIADRRAAQIDDLLSGFANLKDAEDDVRRLQSGIELIEREIASIDDEIANATGQHKKNLKNSKARHRRKLQRELQQLRDERSKALQALDDMTSEVFDVRDIKGRVVTFDNYDDAVRYLDQEINATIDANGKMLDRLTDEERKRWEEGYANRIRTAEMRREKMLSQAADRVERNVRSGERRGIVSFLSGRSRRGFSEDDIRLLSEMHAMDVSAGRAERRFSRKEIENFRAYRQAQAAGYALPLVDPATEYRPYGRRQRMLDRFDDVMDETRGRRIINQSERAAAGSRLGAAAVGLRQARDAVGRSGRIITDAVTKKVPKDTILDAAKWMLPHKGIVELGKGVTGLTKKFQTLFKHGGEGMVLLSGMFGPLGAGMSGVIAAVAPLLPIIIAIGAVVLILWKNFKKWIDTARPGLEKLKEAASTLKDAVLEPIMGLFHKLGGEGDKTGNLWKNIGKIIGKVAEYIAVAFELIAPVIRFVMRMIADNIYILVQLVRAVVAIITGDWSDLGDALKNIWMTAWNAVKRILGTAMQFIITVFYDALIKMMQLAEKANPGSIFGMKVPGLSNVDNKLHEIIDNLKIMKKESKGMFDGWVNAGTEGEKAAKKAKKAAQDELNSGDPPQMQTPEIDPAEVRENVRDFISAFQDSMRRVVDGWKQAAMDAFDEWAKASEKAVQDRIDAIDKEIEAERKRDQDLEYLRRKEELRNRRRSEQIRYQTDRDLAIYEGRYDDAKQLDYDYSQTLAALQRDEEELERDRQRTLTERMRNAQKERLELEKEELRKSLDIKREQMQRQLDIMTEYLPRNVAQAQAMQEAIHAKMKEYTDGYGTIGAMQAENWAANWSSAMERAKTKVADDAYWAGEEAMRQFAAGLGIDPASLNTPEENAAIANNNASRQRATYVPGGATQAQVDEYKKRHGIYHAGGPVGNTAMGPYDVPATLQTGEYVIRRSAVAKYGLQKMEQINKGQAVFHEGGYVGMAYAAMSNVFNRAKDAFMGGARIGMARDESGNFFGGFTAEEYKSALSQAAGVFAGAIMGAVEGLHPEFLRRFHAWNAALGGKFRIGSGYRSFAEQQRLYDRWLRRVPGQAQAAPPGRSNHNWGLAIDLVPSRTTAAERALGAKYGLRWPMSFEPWHVEPVEAKQWRDAMSRGQYIPESEMVGDRFFKLRSDLFGPGGATGGDARGIVKSLMGQYGWGNDQWPALERLVQKESGWNPSAKNPKSTAVGLFQFLKSTWDNYITRKGGPGYWSQDINWQAKGGLDYIAARYGSPAAALAFHNKNNWYHKGGLVFDIPSLDVGGKIVRDGIAMVHANERVLNPAETAAFEAGVGNTELHLHFDGGFFGSDREISRLVDKINTEVIPKLNRAQGTAKRTFGRVTK